MGSYFFSFFQPFYAANLIIIIVLQIGVFLFSGVIQQKALFLLTGQTNTLIFCAH